MEKEEARQSSEDEDKPKKKPKKKKSGKAQPQVVDLLDLGGEGSQPQ